MNLRSLTIAVALLLLALFALLNWPAFIAPTTLSLGFTEVQAPLGLIMLVATGVLCGLFLIYILFQQAGVIVEARRYAKELQSHRDLADQAEASRFTELRLFVESEFKGLEQRVEQLHQRLEEKVAESTLSLSAYVGEVDDKLDRALGQPGAPR